MKAMGNETMATYFGLQVEVVVMLDYNSLIHFQGREVIVETADLVFGRSFSCAT
jgi:hypothetical protein